MLTVTSQCDAADSCDSITPSDHVPVAASFELDVDAAHPAGWGELQPNECPPDLPCTIVLDGMVLEPPVPPPPQTPDPARTREHPESPDTTEPAGAQATHALRARLPAAVSTRRIDPTALSTSE
jgi:hypothetical protein